MAHKTKIGGTNYEISGGKVKVGNTVYSISEGKTKVSATNYEIPFKKTGWTCVYTGQKTSSGTATYTAPAVAIPADTVAIIVDLVYGSNNYTRGGVAYKLDSTWCKQSASTLEDIIVSTSNTVTIKFAEYASGTITKWSIFALSGKGSWSNSSVTISKDNLTTISGKTGWKFAVFGCPGNSADPATMTTMARSNSYFGAVGYDEINSFSGAVTTSATIKSGNVLVGSGSASTADANLSGRYSNSTFTILNASESASKVYSYYCYI